MKLIQRLRYKLERTLKKVWWNGSVHMSETIFPIVRWEGRGYLDCEEGLIVPMKELPDGKYAYYEVTKIHRKSGGDWLYPSDAIDCDMVFHSVRKELGIGNLKDKKKGLRFVEHTP